VLNVEKARFEKMLSSERITTLIATLGTSIWPGRIQRRQAALPPHHHHDRCRCGRRPHRTLLLTLCYRQMPQLVERGHIYIAQPPLYNVKAGCDERYLKDTSKCGEPVGGKRKHCLIIRCAVFDPREAHQ
jgi:DNA gyrase subunit B